jgi:small conductance mechanosensitive channel
MLTLAIRPYAASANYWDAFFTVQEDVKNTLDKNGITGPATNKD